jgi:hypothetical protein
VHTREERKGIVILVIRWPGGDRRGHLEERGVHRREERVSGRGKGERDYLT